MSTKQIILDRELEFEKFYVWVLSAPAPLRLKALMDFNRQTILLVLNSLREEIQEKQVHVPLLIPGGIMGLGNNFKEHDEKIKHNTHIQDILNLLSQSIEALEDKYNCFYCGKKLVRDEAQSGENYQSLYCPCNPKYRLSIG